MDENTKRWMLFMLVALLLFNFFYVLPQAKRREQMERQRAEAAKAAGTDLASTGNQGTTNTLTVGGTVPGPASAALEEMVSGEEITVETQIYRITFTTAGADPIRWQIIDPAYSRATQSDVDEAETLGWKRLKVGDDLPVEIIPDYSGLGTDREYPLMVVLKELGGEYFKAFNRGVYEVERSIEPDGTQVLRFTSPFTKEGLRLVKTFRFARDQYLTELRLEIENPVHQGAQKLSFTEPTRPGLGLIWGPGIGRAQVSGRMAAYSYSVAACDDGTIISASPSWQKARSSEPVDRDLVGNLKWGLIESRFYMATIIPKGAETSPLVRAAVDFQNIPPNEADRKNMSPPFTAEVFSRGFTLAPGEAKVFDYDLYVGPKRHTLLAQIDRQYGYGLGKVLFHRCYRITRVLANFMLLLLDWFYNVTHNYGVAIILVTVLVRVVTQPFTHIQMKQQARSAAEMKRIKPLLDANNEKYKNDPQKRNAEQWKIYKEHGVNPLGMLKGCFWMLIQIPIFIALFRLLSDSIDLRGAGFLWIRDLTAQDALFTLPFRLPLVGNKFNLIPILMGVSQLFAQRLQAPMTDDPTQKQMAILMPIFLTVMFYTFPAGLSLYWFVSNIWQILFQIFVNKGVREEAERKVHRAFEDRQAGAAKALPADSTPKQPGMREKLMTYLEAKAKQAENKRKNQRRTKD